MKFNYSESGVIKPPFSSPGVPWFETWWGWAGSGGKDVKVDENCFSLAQTCGVRVYNWLLKYAHYRHPKKHITFLLRYCVSKIKDERDKATFSGETFSSTRKGNTGPCEPTFPMLTGQVPEETRTRGGVWVTPNSRNSFPSGEKSQRSLAQRIQTPHGGALTAGP